MYGLLVLNTSSYAQLVLRWYIRANLCITSDPNTSIKDANDVSRILAESLKTCLNPPRGRGEKRIGTLASEDGHKWKCEVDRPSRSTEVNPGRKQKRCSLSCLWSQVQRDTSGPDNSQTLGCLWTKHHRCTCMWNWTETPTVSSRLRAKTV